MLEFELYCWEGAPHAVSHVNPPVVEDTYLDEIKRHQGYCLENDCTINVKIGNSLVEITPKNVLYSIYQVVITTGYITKSHNMTAWFKLKD